MLDRKIAVLRGALFLALALLFQGLRLVIPLPPPAGMLLIGILVNMTLLLALRYAGIMPALCMSALLPFVAFLQGQLAIPPLIPVVLLGNMALVLCCRRWRGKPLVWLAPLCKAAILYGGALLLLRWLALPAQLCEAILLAMSWPQIATAAAGMYLAEKIAARLPTAPLP